MGADLASAKPPGGSSPKSTLVVRAGDSLWSIATDLSPPDSADIAVADMVARLYGANRSVVGDDPDLIYPGTLLHAPGGPS
jgi:nucleoid-associated protein YgaU